MTIFRFGFRIGLGPSNNKNCETHFAILRDVKQTMLVRLEFDHLINGLYRARPFMKIINLSLSLQP